HPERIQGLGLVGGPHTTNFFPTRAETIKVLGSANRMLESPTEFPSLDAAYAYLKSARPRDQESALRHRLEHNFVKTGAGVAVKYDKVRVAIGLAHMADALRKYAARASCPVAILRGTRSSELTMAQAKEIAGCWKNAAVVDVEGDYALQMENPAGLAEALAALAPRACRRAPSKGRTRRGGRRGWGPWPPAPDAARRNAMPTESLAELVRFAPDVYG